MAMDMRGSNPSLQIHIKGSQDPLCYNLVIILKGISTLLSDSGWRCGGGTADGHSRRGAVAICVGGFRVAKVIRLSVGV